MPRRLSVVDQVLGANSASWLWALDRFDYYKREGKLDDLAKDLQSYFKQSTGGQSITRSQANQWIDRVSSARQAAAAFSSTQTLPSGTGQYRQTFLSPSKPWTVRAQAIFLDQTTGVEWREDIEINMSGPPSFARIQARVNQYGAKAMSLASGGYGPGRTSQMTYQGMHIRTVESLTWDN